MYSRRSLDTPDARELLENIRSFTLPTVRLSVPSAPRTDFWIALLRL